MKLTNILEQVLNAADQAHKLHLKSIGFGRWANKNGKVIAQTKDGKLEMVKDKNKVQKNEKCDNENINKYYDSIKNIEKEDPNKVLNKLSIIDQKYRSEDNIDDKEFEKRSNFVDKKNRPLIKWLQKNLKVKDKKTALKMHSLAQHSRDPKIMLNQVPTTLKFLGHDYASYAIDRAQPLMGKPTIFGGDTEFVEKDFKNKTGDLGVLSPIKNIKGTPVKGRNDIVQITKKDIKKINVRRKKYGLKTGIIKSMKDTWSWNDIRGNNDKKLYMKVYDNKWKRESLRFAKDELNKIK